MRRQLTFLIFVFAILTLTITQLATADYSIGNGSATEAAWVTYGSWQAASDGWPAGFRTGGWYKVEPSGFRNLPVPSYNTWVYIRVERAGKEIKPPDQATRDQLLFQIHPSKAFTVVETPEGAVLKSNVNRWSLEQAEFYVYRNGEGHTVTDDPGQNLPDLPARQIYDQAIDSVVWIETTQWDGFGKGSGVLIDKERKLVVTNEHVIEGARAIYVFFPWSNRNGILNKEQDFYLENWESLENLGYASGGRVIARNVRDDLAILQLDQLPPTAREINHDFSRQVEANMNQGDKVHILGNPGERLWNWTQGTFVESWGSCLPSGGTCLEMEGDTHGGNSGGAVLNGQGVLIGILAAGTDETVALAAPARNVKALLDTLRPRHTFKIENNIGVPVHYQIRWSNNRNWKQESVNSGRARSHWWTGENVSQGYPKIRFDYIAGDQQVTYRVYTLDTSLQFLENNYDVPTYFFKFNLWGNRLDLVRKDAALAPVLSRAVPKETVLLPNYPNPFNPETWIPYHLAKPADVTLTIYTADGRLIRTLVLGHQPAGVYQSKSRAAYWDGRNALGEPVASGVYFYTLKAGDITATRKMLIRK